MEVIRRVEGRVLVLSLQIMRVRFRIEMAESLFEDSGLVPRYRRMLSMPTQGDILESSG